MKVKAEGGHNVFYPPVSSKRAFAWCKQQLPCGILKAEYHNGNRTCDGNDTEKHSAEHFQMSAECQESFIVFTFALMH